MTEITFTGDPADLVLSEGDSLVLYDGDRITSRTAIAVTYDGTAGSLTFDPSTLGSPAKLTARRTQRNISAEDAHPSTLTPSRAPITASPLTPADATRVTGFTRPGRITGSAFR